MQREHPARNQRKQSNVGRNISTTATERPSKVGGHASGKNVSRNKINGTTTFALLDLVLGDWLCSTRVTTLPRPKISVASMCFNSVTDKKADFSVRVEALGSGAVLVPRLSVHAHTTTVGDLFDRVLQHDGGQDLSVGVQLFFGERELQSGDSHALLADVINHATDVKPDTSSSTIVVNAVMMSLKQANAKCEFVGFVGFVGCVSRLEYNVCTGAKPY